MSKIDYSKIPLVKLTYTREVPYSDLVEINNSADIDTFIRGVWESGTIDHHEQFKVVLLNRANKILGIADLSQGGTTGTVVDVKIVLQQIILSNACAIVLVHNHPSGNLSTSNQDLLVTKKLQKSVELFDVKLLDHIIITSESYYSMADEGDL